MHHDDIMKKYRITCIKGVKMDNFNDKYSHALNSVSSMVEIGH